VVFVYYGIGVLYFIYWYPYTPKTRQALNKGLKTPVFSLVKMIFPIYIFLRQVFLFKLRNILCKVMLLKKRNTKTCYTITNQDKN
jgi:hypothetical protein